MDYAEFTEELKRVFHSLLPHYIGKAGEKIGTKIKPSDGTPVTSLDHYTLKLLREIIAKHFPDDFTIGEEDQQSPEQIARILARRDQYQWTIDGLDGTGNLRVGTNSYDAAISRRYGNTILYAAIFQPVDYALREEGFLHATRGSGTWEWYKTKYHYYRRRTAEAGELERMVIMLEGSSKKFFSPPIVNLGLAETTRASFSSCVAATAVARGRASALVTIGNKPWDNWPVILMIEEAGGVVTDFKGNPPLLESCCDIVAAGNKTDLERIIALLNPSRGDVG